MMIENEDADAALEVKALRTAADSMVVGATLDSSELQSLCDFVCGNGELGASPEHMQQQQQQQQLAMQLTSPYRQHPRSLRLPPSLETQPPPTMPAPPMPAQMPAPPMPAQMPAPPMPASMPAPASMLASSMLAPSMRASVPDALHLLQLQMQSNAVALQQQQAIHNAMQQQQLQQAALSKVIPASSQRTTTNPYKCTKCGGPAKLETGAGRDMYTYICQDAQCAFEYNVSRIANPDGSYNVYEKGSRRNCEYRCGLCGACPKKGHICSGKVAAADDDGDDDDAGILPPLSSMDVESAKRALENAKALSGGARLMPPSADGFEDFQEDDKPAAAATIDAPATLTEAAAATASSTVTQTDENANMAECKLGGEKKKESAQPQGMATALVRALATTITGQDAYRKLGLCRKKVKGDGSCLYYAVLANYGECEHAHTRYERMPTTHDRSLDAFLRETTVKWLNDHCQAHNFTEEETATIDSHLIMPKYPLKTDKDFGTFATNINVLALASFFETPIVVWDRTTLLNPNTLQHVYDVDHDAEGTVIVSERYWSYSHVVSKADERTLVHVEFDGVNHYSALVGTEPVPLLDHVIAALELAKTVPAPPSSVARCASFGSANKRGNSDCESEEGLPVGWIKLTDQYRDVDDASTDIAVAEDSFDDLESQLADAKSNGYNAVMFLYEDDDRTSVRKIMYIRYAGGIVDASSCHDTDIPNTLFVYNDPKNKKQKVLPPTDSYACCGVYRLGYDGVAIDCALCGKFFHVACVEPAGMTDEQRQAWVDDIAPNWICDACDGTMAASTRRFN